MLIRENEINYSDAITRIYYEAGIYKYNTRLLNRHKALQVFDEYLNYAKGKIYFLWGNSSQGKFFCEILNDEQKKKVILPDATKKRNQVCLPNSVRKEVAIVMAPTYQSKIWRELRRLLLIIFNRKKVVDLYDVFEDNGVKLKEDLCRESGIGYQDIVEDLRNIQSCISDIEKCAIVKKIIVDYLEIRDFIHAFEYIDMLKELGDSDYSLFFNLKIKIESLLKEIEDKIRGKEHIVVNWIDALRHDELGNMQFLSNLAQRGISFNNMFDVAPYTNAAMKTLFTGKLLIEDELFAETMDCCTNSALSRVLKSYGYKFIYFGTKFNTGIFKNFEVAKRCAWYEGYAPSTLLQFEAICRMATEQEKCFIIIHNLSETHAPCMNGECADTVPIDYDNLLQLQEKKCKDSSRMLKQISESEYALDRQLEFYHRFYEDVSYNLYMSDHGVCRYEQPICFVGQNKVVFIVTGQSVHPYQHNRISSLISFPKIIEKIVEGVPEDIIDIYNREYAIIQQDDIYGVGRIESFKKQPELYKPFYLQHRGVVTEKDAYVRYITGEEYYFFIGDTRNLIEDDKYSERIKQMREWAGCLYIDIRNEKKYRFTRELYEQMGYQINEENIEFYVR